MPEIGPSGLMSGEGKRGDAAWPKLPRLSSTLPTPRVFGLLGWRTHAIDPSFWIGLRQLAVQRIGD
jgi:hypothetical protein